MIDRGQQKPYIRVHYACVYLSLLNDRGTLAQNDGFNALGRNLLNVDRETSFVLPYFFALRQTTDDADLSFIFPLIGMDPPRASGPCS